MVLPLESYFHQERVLLETWSGCLFADLQHLKPHCAPYDLKQGFPWRVFGLCVLYCIGSLLFIRRFVAIPLGTLLLTFAERRTPLTARAESIKAREFRKRKFTGSFVEFCFYTFFFIVGSLLLRRQPWTWPSSEWWSDSPAERVEAHLLIFALFYSARYCASFVSLVLLEPRKKDFIEMTIHHVVTVILVNLAIAHGLIKIGIVIMVLFDAADPLLHIAKLFNYIKQAAGHKGPSFSFVWVISQITDIFLACFAIVFTISRICLYTYVVYSVSYEGYLYLNCPDGGCTFVEGLSNVDSGFHVCVALVWIINFLQWYWFKLLVRVIYKSLFEGVSDDARSDQSEDDVKIKTAPPSSSGKFKPVGVDDDDDAGVSDEDGTSKGSIVPEVKKTK